MECQHTELIIVRFNRCPDIDDVHGLTWQSCSAQVTASALANAGLEQFYCSDKRTLEVTAGEREIPEGHHP